MRLVIIIVLGCGLSVLGGCQRPAGTVSMERPEVRVARVDFDQAWDEVLDVLSEHYFQSDYQNPRSGRIVTHPTVSKQWFEFWRDDALGAYQQLESSLHTIRRRVEVTFVPVDDSYDVNLAVHIQRKTQPQRQVTTASGALQIYREKLPIYTGEKLPAAAAGVWWVNVGTDGLLEAYLLERIANRLGTGMLEAQQPGSDTQPAVRPEAQ